MALDGRRFATYMDFADVEKLTTVAIESGKHREITVTDHEVGEITVHTVERRVSVRVLEVAA